MKPGSTLHITLPNRGGERLLHRCVVLEVGEEELTVSLAQPNLPIETGMDVVLFYDRHRDFMQQVARVGSIQDVGSVRMVDLTTVNDPVSAENRRNFRVATMLSNAWVKLDSNPECLVRDASVTGFAVISPDRYETGQVVLVELSYAGRNYTGHASVQNVRQLPAGRARYGFYCLGKRGYENDLKTGLWELTLNTQREQLAN